MRLAALPAAVQEPQDIGKGAKARLGFKLIVTRALNTAFQIAAMVLIAPLFVVLIILPVLAFCAVRDCLGLNEPEPQNNAIRDEWDKWQAQNRQRAAAGQRPDRQ